MGLLILLFAGLWIAGCSEDTGSMGMKHKYDHDSADETEVVAVAGGAYHNIELKSDGTIWAWGDNEYGQLGDGTTIDSPAPIQVSGLTDVTAIAAGGSHTIALKTDGTVWAWGYNGAGQLGNGTTIDSATPVQVNSLTEVVAIAAGGLQTLALKTDGTVWEWGFGVISQSEVETIEECKFGSMGLTCSNTPVQVSDLTDVTAIAKGPFYSLALKTDGTVWAWGDNEFGQLGNGTTIYSPAPIQVSGLTDVTAIAAGGEHSLALKTDGTRSEERRVGKECRSRWSPYH